MIRLHPLLALLLLALLLPLQARAAVTCTATPSIMDFGTVTTSPIPATATTANLAVHCTSTFLAATDATMCLSISAGSGTGSNGTTNPTRDMSSGANQVQYQIYSNSGHTIVWGSSEVEFDFGVPVFGGTADETFTIYGLVLNPPAQSKPSGTYQSTLTLSGHYDSRLGGGVPTCASVDSGGTAITPSTFIAQLILNSTCTISANNINFGTFASLATAQNMGGSLGVTCNNAAPYTITMNAGSTTGNTIAARKMSLNGAGAGVVSYQLYRDGFGTTLWGDGTGGSSIYTGTGSGSLQTIPVYAQMPGQTTPTPGTYKDTVTASITY